MYGVSWWCTSLNPHFLVCVGAIISMILWNWVFFFMFWLCWVFTAWGFVELQRAGGPQAPCGRWTFHCCGFSCYGAQALGFSCSLAAVIRLQCGRPGFDPWVGKMPWRREWLTTPVFWPGEFHGLLVHGVAKSRTQLSDFSLSL